MRSLGAFLLLALAACDNSGEENRVIANEDLDGQGVVGGATGWQSVPIPSPEQCDGASAPTWISLRGKQHQRTLTIEHGLGRVPGVVLPYISFSPNGCGSTLASGDLLVVDFVDADTIQVRNNTQESFYLRVVLQ